MIYFSKIISFIHSFVRSCVRPSVRSFVRSFVHSFIHSSLDGDGRWGARTGALIVNRFGEHRLPFFVSYPELRMSSRGNHFQTLTLCCRILLLKPSSSSLPFYCALQVTTP